jgi:hypothetical protein
MVIFKESRHLETLKCYYNESMDVFIFHCAGKKITIQYASPEQIASVFRKAQVKDEATEPGSVRGKHIWRWLPPLLTEQIKLIIYGIQP